jgi:hypothetical protein
MKLKDISSIFSGYITRGKIVASADGGYYLVQAKDVDGERSTYRTDRLVRFHPNLTRTDRRLQSGDLLFMARGAHMFAVQIHDLPGPSLAAACFFIVRLSSPAADPDYVGWYLNQSPVAQYLFLHSGRGVHMPVVRRAVLENIEVPLPPLDIQKKIAEMSRLMVKEMELLRQLGRKRGELIAAACLRVASRH